MYKERSPKVNTMISEKTPKSIDKKIVMMKNNSRRKIKIGCIYRNELIPIQVKPSERNTKPEV